MKKKFFKNNDDNQVNMLNCGTRHLYSKRKNTEYFYSTSHSSTHFVIQIHFFVLFFKILISIELCRINKPKKCLL